jgi:nucleotide-binding universal stress UspA family protein
MNLLIAIDESSCSADAIAAVIERYRPAGAEVRVLHVIEWPHDLPTSLAFAEGPSAAASVLRAKDDRWRRGHELLAEAVERLQHAHFSATAQLVEGAPRQVIVAMAANWPADIIVIGSHRRHGLPRFLLGSVSDAVVRHARCSVHVVRERMAKRDVDASVRPAHLSTTVHREGVTS